MEKDGFTDSPGGGARFEETEGPQLAHPVYRADIDGLRAVAVLSVVGFHAFPTRLKGGFIGVDVFFVISGFLISTIILGSLQRGNFSFLDFYTRRVKRIFPALFIVLFACLVFGWFALLADEYKQLGKHVAGGGGFISNFLLWNESGYFDSAADKKPLLHLWSLGIEEQFYIVWPLLLWIAWRVRLNLLAITLLVAIGSFAFGIGKLESESVAAFYSPLARFWELLVGAALAYVSLQQARRALMARQLGSGMAAQVGKGASSAENETLLANALSMLGLALIAAGVFLLDKTVPFPGWWAILPTIGAALLIHAGPTSWVNRFVLSNPAVVWIGLISFPLYLWHWPLLAFARILEGEMPAFSIRVSAVAASVVLAWLTYRFVERPVRFGKRGNAKAVGLVFLMTLTAASGYRVYLDDGMANREVALNNADPEQRVFPQSNLPVPCTGDPGYAIVSPFCNKFVAEHPVKTIVVWGDSSAAAWQTVFLDIAKEKNYTVAVISHEGCSPLLNQEARGLYGDRGGKLSSCQRGLMQQKAVELIRELKPDAIVHIAAWNWLRDLQARQQEGQSAEHAKRFERRLFDTVNELEKIGKLLVFKSWPLLPKEPNYKVSRMEFFQSTAELTFVDARDFNRDSQYIHAALDRAASSSTEFFSPSGKICTDKCWPIFQGVKMYQDAYHITALGSMQFRPEIEKLLEAVPPAAQAAR